MKTLSGQKIEITRIFVKRTFEGVVATGPPDFTNPQLLAVLTDRAKEVLSVKNVVTVAPVLEDDSFLPSFVWMIRLEANPTYDGPMRSVQRLGLCCFSENLSDSPIEIVQKNMGGVHWETDATLVTWEED